MAKALLLNALHDALSDYVVGLSPERLKFGVWSGKIELNELEVRDLLCLAGVNCRPGLHQTIHSFTS